MGYSCTGKAAAAEGAIFTSRAAGDLYGAAESLAAGGYGGEVTNGWQVAGVRYFLDRGREQPDGAITGQVWCQTPGSETCSLAGNLRIEPDGFISRWPRASAESLIRKVRLLRVQEEALHSEYYRILNGALRFAKSQLPGLEHWDERHFAAAAELFPAGSFIAKF
ncbi:MAG: hypothetical protein WC381_10670, partial [Kiritimatiellia bacterium]